MQSLLDNFNSVDLYSILVDIIFFSFVKLDAKRDSLKIFIFTQV